MHPTVSTLGVSLIIQLVEVISCGEGWEIWWHGNCLEKNIQQLLYGCEDNTIGKHLGMHVQSWITWDQDVEWVLNR